MDVFDTCFNFQSIYQVVVLQEVGISYKYYCHLLTVEKSFVASPSQSLSSSHILNVFAGALKMREWKMQEWKIQENTAEVEIAGVGKAGVDRTGGICRSGKSRSR